jgi:hypothetical protein
VVSLSTYRDSAMRFFFSDFFHPATFLAPAVKPRKDFEFFPNICGDSRIHNRIPSVLTTSKFSIDP